MIDFLKIIRQEKLTPNDFQAFFSIGAEDYLEPMAQRAHQLTLKNFGRTIQLYTPLYLSNYCENQCLYCGFNSKNKIKRNKLGLEQVRQEGEAISASGLRHILILTGESRLKSSLAYIKQCIRILKKYFDSVSIEIYPLKQSEYKELALEGVDGLTIYQEVYNEKIYDLLHPQGPKKDYNFRLSAPERGAAAGIRNINIGALLGLNDWKEEIFSLGSHAKYLQDKYPQAEIGISVPRIRPQTANFKPRSVVTDKNLVQIILALRIFLPRLGITLSTRERADFRDNLIPLGITRMSAGSVTSVGGHRIKIRTDEVQFEISDPRSVSQIKSILEKKGYQPVLKDWMHF